MSASARRSYGTGGLYVRRDHRGRETWYGKWREGERQVKRRIGLKRPAGTRDGLTRTQAEAALRQLVAEAASRPAVAERITFEQAARRHLERLRRLGRKRSTLMGYDTLARIHLAPFFADMALERIDRRVVQRFIAWMERRGASAKTVRNALGLLHGVLEYAVREELIAVNAVKHVDKPRQPDVDADIRFLEPEEVEALIRAVPDDPLGPVDRVMYLTAVMTGMRQGELLALRWIDVDFVAQRVRVRRNFVRGEYGTPKSKRSSRSVPLADRLAGELDRLHRSSAYADDEDLVFAHPWTGGPIDRSKLLKRYKNALVRAGVRTVRFHDLRHTFGTRMAAQGVPMRTLQEWMGHRDLKTTLIYADYAPSAREAEWINGAFGLAAPAQATPPPSTR